jgi:hypothetical protein
MAPESAFDHQGHVVGDAYVEVSPADPEYARLASQAISEEEVASGGWQEGDEGPAPRVRDTSPAGAMPGARRLVSSSQAVPPAYHAKQPFFVRYVMICGAVSRDT